MMTSVWMRARAGLRSRLPATLVLAAIIGLAGGAVLTAAAGARRTDTAYQRFLQASGAPDLSVGGVSQGTGPLPGYRGVPLRRVAALPQVRKTLRFTVFLFGGKTETGQVLPQFDVGAVASNGGTTAGIVPRMRVTEGRLPDPGRVDEIAVGYAYAGRKGLTVGTHITMPLFDRRALLQEREKVSGTVDLEVTAIVLAPGMLPESPNFWQVLLTPAFYRAYAGKYGVYPQMAVWLKGGDTELASFRAEVDRLAHGTAYVVPAPGRDTAAVIERSTHIQAIALWSFALLLGVAAFLIFGQVFARQALLDSADHSILRALGLTRWQLFGAAMAPAVVISTVAAIVAAVTAVIASRLMPIGAARLAEPHPGLSVDGLVVGGGVALLAVLVLGLGALASSRVTRLGASSFRSPRAGRRSLVAETLARRGFPPTAVSGVRMATEPGRGRTAVPVRSALAGVTLSIVALGAALTFQASYTHWHDTPRLYGWNWDRWAGGPYAPSTPGEFRKGIARLRSSPEFDALSEGAVLLSIRLRTSGGRDTDANVWGMSPVRGSVFLPLVEGRWPRSADEIALGAETLRSLGAQVGERVEVSGSDADPVAMQVVGRAVFPELSSGGSDGLGVGAGVTLAGVARLGLNSDPNSGFVRFAPGVSDETGTRTLGRIAGGVDVVAGPIDGTDIMTYRDADGIPITLSGLLALMAAATLAHTLISSLRRRRRDLAILKTLGFVRRQVAATLAWQATTITLVAMLVGLPLGVAAGRWGWNLFADRIGIVPEAVAPLAAILLAVPGAIVLANAVAAIPAWAAGRTRAAMELRTE